MELKDKRALVFGVANSRSLAWSIAQSYSQQGAEVILVCQTQRLLKKVEPLAKTINAKVLVCDVTDDIQLKETFDQVDKIDILAHAIAYAPVDSISSPLSSVSKDDFLKTIEISCFSLIKIVGIAKPFMNKCGCFITLSYLGAQRVMTGYNLMGVAKASLEASVRYLSLELGELGLRINTISAGPVKTLSSSVFPNFNKTLELVKDLTPMKENITGSDVGELASFLSSDRAKLITGSLYYVDSGAHIMGA